MVLETSGGVLGREEGETDKSWDLWEGTPAYDSGKKKVEMCGSNRRGSQHTSLKKKKKQK